MRYKTVKVVNGDVKIGIYTSKYSVDNFFSCGQTSMAVYQIRKSDSTKSSCSTMAKLTGMLD